MIKFSVLLSVYNKDNPEFLQQALDSIANQDLLPNEMVIVEDGPLTDKLTSVLDAFCRQGIVSIKRTKIAENTGLGNALSEGIKLCSYDYIARMDSDDINIRDRFAKQVAFFSEHNDISVLGGYIEEFAETPGDLGRIKKVPISPDAVRRIITKRCPLNHVSVMFKKKDIEACKSYENVLLFEDYYLWFKVNKAGFNMANLTDTLLYVRIGNDMISRRRGWVYLEKELTFISRSLTNKLISKKDAILMVLFRMPVRMMPKIFIKALYRFFLR